MPKKYGIAGFGFPNFEVAVNRFEKQYIREVKRIVAETAEMMVSQMRTLSPVSEIDGGNLKRSIDAVYELDGLRAIITVGAEYAIYVEKGTGIYAEDGDGRKTPWVYYSEKLGIWVFMRGIKAQPFFRPSVEIAGRHFEREMNRLG